MKIMLIGAIVLASYFAPQAHADEYVPYVTYECLGQPASTAMDGDERLQDWPIGGQVGDDIVVCRAVAP